MEAKQLQLIILSLELQDNRFRRLLAMTSFKNSFSLSLRCSSFFTSFLLVCCPISMSLRSSKVVLCAVRWVTYSRCTDRRSTTTGVGSHEVSFSLFLSSGEINSIRLGIVIVIAVDDEECCDAAAVLAIDLMDGDDYMLLLDIVFVIVIDRASTSAWSSISVLG